MRNGEPISGEHQPTQIAPGAVRSSTFAKKSAVERIELRRGERRNALNFEVTER